MKLETYFFQHNKVTIYLLYLYPIKKLINIDQENI